MAKTDMKEITRRMVNDQNTWPNWPYLPMKRYPTTGFPPGHGLTETGIVMVGKTIVYIGNLFQLPKTQEEWDSLQKHEYPTFEAMIDDGWIVD